MKLYVCMILSGSICTLAYLIFNRILPYEMSLKWMRLIFAALVVFCLLSVGGLFLYGRIYRQFIRRSEISDDNWRMESKGLWRKIRIGYSPLASSPVTVGMIRPVILFPSGGKQYSDSKEEKLSGMNWSDTCLHTRSTSCIFYSKSQICRALTGDIDNP